VNTGKMIILGISFSVVGALSAHESPCTPATLAATVVSRPSAAELDQAVRAAQKNIQVTPCVAALLLGRNQPGDAHRALYLLENFLRHHAHPPADSVQLLALLARERAARMGKLKKRSPPLCSNNKGIDSIRQELAELRKEREKFRHEILELRRKLKAITSIERSMDERKTH